MKSTAFDANEKSPCLSKSFAKGQKQLWRAITALYVWICLIRLPASSLRDTIPQSWESVLSFAAAHHLQWGRDIVFTFGPLGFLTSDYYWGNFFWPILGWAFGFSAIITTVVVRFADRLAFPIRIIFYAALPLLTVPLCSDLGFDAVFFLSITLTGIACLPAENPGRARLISSAVLFVVISFIKFTFALYCGFALLVILVANWRSARSKHSQILVGSCVLTLLTTCWATHQSLSSLGRFFLWSWRVAAGYSSAMTIPIQSADLYFGLALLLCVVLLLLIQAARNQDLLAHLPQVTIIGAGTFLAWKEGFVRADNHVVVFFLYSFFLTALLSGLLTTGAPEKLRHRFIPAAGWLLIFQKFVKRLHLPERTVLLSTIACLILALSPFELHRKDFGWAIRQNFIPKYSDSFAAIVNPAGFKLSLERQLDSMKSNTRLPEIRATLGGATVGVLNFDQEIAILNGMNYVPHPVFQSYSAFTPELQSLNQTFFNSAKAPEYLLWRFGTIDSRFPTLDEGSSLLQLLSGYSPVHQEGPFVLWKRNDSARNAPTLGAEHEFAGRMGQWLTIPGEPTWLRVELKPGLIGRLQNFLCSSASAWIEVQLGNGRKLNYRLPPGNARSGFLINPMLQFDAELLGTKMPSPVLAVRVYSPSGWFFQPTIRFVQQTVHGIASLQLEPSAAAPALTAKSE